MYEIDSADTRGNAPRMSAYPKAVRDFTEPVSATADMTIAAGTSLPDLIKKFYPTATPTKFAGRFGFLERDNKLRSYSPGETDPFVFKSLASLKTFEKYAHELMAHLCTSYKELGFRLSHDKDRKIDVPDGTHAVEALNPKHPLHNTLVANKNGIYFILANADIVKKACVVRSINMGWWAVSYAGKTAPNKDYFKTSLAAHKIAIRRIVTSAQGKAKYNQFWADNGDPLYTNPGYPFFTVELDQDGNPVTRIKTVHMFQNLANKGGSWKDLLTEVDKRAGHMGLRGFPFAVAPLRRLQPAYKWQHQFRRTGSGLHTSHDERGVNAQRVAHMVPYIYNLITSPVSTLYKTVRYFLPGCYHDGDAKQRRMATLREAGKQGKLWLAEADYSNFDRFMPVDLILDIVKMFTELTDRPQYWYDAMSFLHTGASLIWPDYTLAGSGSGWVFQPGQLGLLSGVKATSETGTLVNSVVNGEALARLKGWTVDQLASYLLQYLDEAQPVGSKQEYYYVQSDDTELIASQPQELNKHMVLFQEAVKAAGLKGTVEFADRFLMRHLQDGCDRPVPARVWQNTISNETPVTEEIIFLAGLGARTDGLLGLKTVDSFGTGHHQVISPQEASFTKLVIQQLIDLINNARRRSPTALTLLDLLAEEVAHVTPKAGGIMTSGKNAVKLDSIRSAINRELAAHELKLLSGKANAAINSWLYGLHRDRNAPSAAGLLEELVDNSPEIKKAIASMAGKESTFFKFAAKWVGVNQLKL